MDKPLTYTRELAITLLDYPIVEGRRRADLPAALQSTFNEIRDHLSSRIGREGYRALLTRAVVLATDDYPWLDPIRVTKDAQVDGFTAVAGKRTHEQAVDGALGVIDRFIQLLEIFVGRELTVRLLSTASAKTIQTDGKTYKEIIND